MEKEAPPVAALSLHLSPGQRAGQALRATANALNLAASALVEQGDFSTQTSPLSTVAGFAPVAPDSLTVAQCVADFLRAKARAGRSDRYLRQLRVSLSHFIKGRAHAALAGVTVEEIEQWMWNCAQRGPGEKMVCLPEVWRHCTEDSIPMELALIAQAGRELGTHLIVDTQRPEQVNPAITGASTELVCFKLISPESLRAVEKLGAEKSVVTALPVGTFKSYNRLSGGTLAGRVF